MRKKKILKILLVQSPTGRPEEPIYPLGIAYLAGQLDKHEVRGLDLSTAESPSDALSEEIAAFVPEVVAVSLRNIDDSSYPVTYSFIPAFADIMSVLKEWEGTVIVGGTGLSIYPEIILAKFSRIDYAIQGEGEAVLPRLLELVEGTTEYSGLEGKRLLQGGLVDLSSIAPPKYDVFDITPYKDSFGIGVQSRRGCAFRCTYCTYGFLSGKEFRERPVEHVIGDILELKRLGATTFMFVDSVFNAHEDFFTHLVEGIGQADAGLAWGAWLDEKITPEQLKMMKEAGAVKVDFSPDAITDTGLELLGKRSNASELLPAVKAARKAGLHVGINFFNGNPGEGFCALLMKLFFMFRVRITLGWKDTFVNIGTIRVYPGSPMSRQMLNEKAVSEDCDFFEPVFCKPKGLADVLFRLFQKVKRLRHGR